MSRAARAWTYVHMGCFTGYATMLVQCFKSLKQNNSEYSRHVSHCLVGQSKSTYTHAAEERGTLLSRDVWTNHSSLVSTQKISTCHNAYPTHAQTEELLPSLAPLCLRCTQGLCCIYWAAMCLTQSPCPEEVVPGHPLLRSSLSDCLSWIIKHWLN